MRLFLVSFLTIQYLFFAIFPSSFVKLLFNYVFFVVVSVIYLILNMTKTANRK
jgi:hypothetical protein